MLQKILLWRDQADQQLLELLSGSSVALILKLIGAGLAFTFNVLLARLLGAEGAGVYFLALSVITVAVVFGRLGLDKTVLRLISANSGRTIGQPSMVYNEKPQLSFLYHLQGLRLWFCY